MEAQLFSATPPLESLKVLLSRAMGRRLSRRGGIRKIAIIDLEKAHTVGFMDQEMYIELPWEDREPGMVGLLVHTLYGVRRAAAIYEEVYVDLLTADERFRQGLGSPSLFYSESWDVEMLVWGDDFVVVADDEAISDVKKLLERKFALKLKAKLGPTEADDREARVLNLVIP